MHNPVSNAGATRAMPLPRHTGARCGRPGPGNKTRGSQRCMRLLLPNSCLFRGDVTARADSKAKQLGSPLPGTNERRVRGCNRDTGKLFSVPALPWFQFWGLAVVDHLPTRPSRPCKNVLQPATEDMQISMQHRRRSKSPSTEPSWPMTPAWLNVTNKTRISCIQRP